MKDAKVAGILADEFNKLSVEEEKVNKRYRESKAQEDKEVLEQVRREKEYLCNIMYILRATPNIDFDHIVRARVKPGIDEPLPREGYWKQRVEQIAQVLVESYNQAVDMIVTCDLSDSGLFDVQLVKREAAKYLKLLELGVISPNGAAVVKVARPVNY